MLCERVKILSLEAEVSVLILVVMEDALRVQGEVNPWVKENVS